MILDTVNANNEEEVTDMNAPAEVEDVDMDDDDEDDEDDSIDEVEESETEE